MALGAGTIQVCTAAMVYGFKIVQEMTTGLSDWMDTKGYTSVDQIVGRAVPRVTDWQHLNLDYVVKAHIDQTKCIQCGRCHIACEDTSHQAISRLKDGRRHYEVIEAKYIGCNLCAVVCPVEKCITLRPLTEGVDPPLGRRLVGIGRGWSTRTTRRRSRPSGRWSRRNNSPTTPQDERPRSNLDRRSETEDNVRTESARRHLRCRGDRSAPAVRSRTPGRCEQR